MRKSPKIAEPVLPKELLRSAPRPIVLTEGGVAAAASAVLLTACALLAGVLLYGRAEGGAEQARLLRAEGVTTQAQVIHLGRRRGENAKVILNYRYLVSGREYSGLTTLRKRDNSRFTVGSMVPVRYIQSHPAASWMTGYEPTGLPHWLVFAISVSLMLSAVPIAAWLRRQSRLLEAGRPALARVTNIVKLKGRERTTWRVEYEWRLLSGAKRTGRYETAKKPPEIGEFVTIVYDRNEPRKHAIYPLSLVRARP